LCDDLRLLPNQAVSHSVKRLCIDLIEPLYANESHSWTLNGFRDRFRIVGVIFLILPIGLDKLRGHDLCVVALFPSLSG